jgi:hypothetical protein
MQVNKPFLFGEAPGFNREGAAGSVRSEPGLNDRRSAKRQQKQTSSVTQFSFSESRSGASFAPDIAAGVRRKIEGL